jgi:argininosuccinate lyase
MKNSKIAGKLWGGRFSKPADKLAEKFTESISFDHRLYKQDIKGSIAHVKMLAKCGIIKGSERARLVSALNRINSSIENNMKKGMFEYDGGMEDIHTYIEQKVTALAGEETGSKLHTARSRNDQVALDMKLFVKDEIFEVLGLLARMCGVLIRLAEKNGGAVMPVYTHMQPAKPVYFSEYIGAYLEMFCRDISRVLNCLYVMNYSPLGAGAAGGTHLPIDREYTARELGFSGVAENTIDAVSDRDFVVEYVFDLCLVAMHLSRLSEDMVLWISPGFKFISLDDSFMTGSSLLPQKKNPDICELARAKTGKLYGSLVSLLTIMKALPLSYNRDLQEDKQSLFSATDTVKLTLRIYIKMLVTLKVNEAMMLKALKGGYITSLFMADSLVREGVGLRIAHRLVGKLVGYCEKHDIDFDKLSENKTAAGEVLDGLSGEIDGKLYNYLKKHFRSAEGSTREEKTRLLKKLFNEKMLKETSFDSYIHKGSDLGGSAKGNLKKRLDAKKTRIKEALAEAEKLLRLKFDRSLP